MGALHLLSARYNVKLCSCLWWQRMHKELLARGTQVYKDQVRKLMDLHGVKIGTKHKFVAITGNRNSFAVAPDLVQRRFNP